ncbi:MAG: lysostaphin resistance A-like protein, partial [Pyrinomonadaceae bacterium]
VPYVSSKGFSQEVVANLAKDKIVVLLSIISIFPAHILSLFIAWGVVTNFGKRSFWKTLGIGWSSRLALKGSVAIAIVLFFVGAFLSWAIKGEETDIDLMIKSSTAARVSLALLAVTTGPFVEEVIYRGVLYSGLRKVLGTHWAVFIVSLLFTLVHVAQYKNNIGVITAVAVLSVVLTLVRAHTGRLLPCIVIHTVFNGITSVLIVLQPYLEKVQPSAEQPPVGFLILYRTTRAFVAAHGF